MEAARPPSHPTDGHGPKPGRSPDGQRCSEAGERVAQRKRQTWVAMCHVILFMGNTRGGDRQQRRLWVPDVSGKGEDVLDPTG